MIVKQIVSDLEAMIPLIQMIVKQIVSDLEAMIPLIQMIVKPIVSAFGGYDTSDSDDS
jgi:phage-related protein